MSFRHAVALLREGLPSFAAETANTSASTPVKRSTARKLDSPVNRDADDQALLNQVIDDYHATLKQSPEALASLKSRGMGYRIFKIPFPAVISVRPSVPLRERKGTFADGQWFPDQTEYCNESQPNAPCE